VSLLSEGVLPVEAEIQLVPHDDDWSRLFESERELLLDAVSEYVKGGIEHVGSTAVPGLLAKPVIDIMVGVNGLVESMPAVTVLKQLNYHYFPYRSSEMHWLCKPSPSFRTHHLHLVPFQSDLWIERVAFRDYLRSHPDVAVQYGQLKANLANEFRFDREAYTDAKGPFIRRVVEQALVERTASG
jgi:GrpB-like predicted nucleotidyltransferase (UPF0157 family)